jgi:hypothetical protein
VTNEQIDAAVLKSVMSGHRLFYQIHFGSKGLALCGMRDIDKSLQRLRRAGKIFYQGPARGWNTLEAAK